MDEQQFKAITALLQGLNSSGSLTPADLSVMQNAILSVLSGTFRQPKIGKTSDELFMENAPSIIHAQESTDTILKNMGQDVISGLSLFDLKQKYKTQIASAGVSGLTGVNVSSEDYLSELSAMKSEWDQYQKAERTNAQLKIDNDPFMKLGLPSFDEQYDPRQTNPEVFSSIAADFQKRRKDSQISKIPYENRAKQLAQSGQRQRDSGTSTNPVGGELKNIPSSTSQQYVDTAKKSITEADTELTAATIAFEDFKKKNPDVYDMEYQDKYDRVQNALKNQGQKMDTAVGFTGASSYVRKPGTSTASSNDNSVGEKQKPYFDREKAQTAAGITKAQEDYVNQTVMQLLSAQMLKQNKTPLIDTLVQNGILATAAKIPKASKKVEKKYTVKGSNVVKLGK